MRRKVNLKIIADSRYPRHSNIFSYKQTGKVYLYIRHLCPLPQKTEVKSECKTSNKTTRMSRQ
jgi:hypothetical protein